MAASGHACRFHSLPAGRLWLGHCNCDAFAGDAFQVVNRDMVILDHALAQSAWPGAAQHHGEHPDAVLARKPKVEVLPIPVNLAAVSGEQLKRLHGRPGRVLGDQLQLQVWTLEHICQRDVGLAQRGREDLVFWERHGALIIGRRECVDRWTSMASVSDSALQ